MVFLYVCFSSLSRLPKSNKRFICSRRNSIKTKYPFQRGVVVSGVRRMNEVNARRARLVLGWVTVFGWVYHLGM